MRAARCPSRRTTLCSQGCVLGADRAARSLSVEPSHYARRFAGRRNRNQYRARCRRNRPRGTNPGRSATAASTSSCSEAPATSPCEASCVVTAIDPTAIVLLSEPRREPCRACGRTALGHLAARTASGLGGESPDADASHAQRPPLRTSSLTSTTSIAAEQRGSSGDFVPRFAPMNDAGKSKADGHKHPRRSPTAPTIVPSHPALPFHRSDLHTEPHVSSGGPSTHEDASPTPRHGRGPAAAARPASRALVVTLRTRIASSRQAYWDRRIGSTLLMVVLRDARRKMRRRRSRARRGYRVPAAPAARDLRLARRRTGG